MIPPLTGAWPSAPRHVTRHAVERYRERIGSGTTAAIRARLAQATLQTHVPPSLRRGTAQPAAFWAVDGDVAWPLVRSAEGDCLLAVTCYRLGVAHRD